MLFCNEKTSLGKLASPSYRNLNVKNLSLEGIYQNCLLLQVLFQSPQDNALTSVLSGDHKIASKQREDHYTLDSLV